MASTAPVSTGWTYQRYLELDDEIRYEIVDGELLMTPAPGTTHQRVIRELFLRFALFVRERRIGEVFVAPYDVVLSETDVVQPDLLFIRADRVGEIVRERAVHGAPDLLVEILSPSSLKRDRWQKRELYERCGVPEFWIVDPANRAIEVLVLGASGYQLFSSAQGEGAVSSRVLDGLAVAVAEVMGELGTGT
jgi:Uma2 family endonuclease